MAQYHVIQTRDGEPIAVHSAAVTRVPGARNHWRSFPTRDAAEDAIPGLRDKYAAEHPGDVFTAVVVASPLNDGPDPL